MFQDARSITRRDAIKGLGSAGAALAALMVNPTIAVAQRKPYEIGYGLYGMRDLPYMEGLGHLARIGYKHVELTLRPGWNTVVFETDRPAMRPPGGRDRRQLAFMVTNLAVTAVPPRRQTTE